MSPLQWKETLEVGDPVSYIKLRNENPVMVIVERVTIRKIFLSNGTDFFRRSPDLVFENTLYPKIIRYSPRKKNKIKSERKQKVLCQRLVRYDWSSLTLDQAQVIYAYLKSGESSNDH